MKLVYGTILALVTSGIVFACGGSSDKDNGNGNADSGSGGGSSGGSTSGSGGSTSGNGGSTTGNGGSTTGNGGSTGSGGTSVTGCDLTPCANIVVFGQALPACCVDATTCGGQVPAQFGGGCLPKSTIDQYTADSGNLTEPIDLDPTCPDLDLPDGGLGPIGFDAGTGNKLKGCCDQTNVCGYAFEADLGGGFTISQCFTQADVPDGGMAPIDAGPPKSCTYTAP